MAQMISVPVAFARSFLTSVEPCAGVAGETDGLCRARTGGREPYGYHQSLSALANEPWRTMVQPFAEVRLALVEALESFIVADEAIGAETWLGYLQRNPEVRL